MKKIIVYNRNLQSGKRPHRKITKFGNYKIFSERVLSESKALTEYQKRVGQISNTENFGFFDFNTSGSFFKES
jgi:hypothetical protein